MVDVARSRILLVEDNPADVYLLKEALRIHGIQFQLQWFSDGEEAGNQLDRFGPDSEAPDLILLDLNLPKVGGKELLSRIRKHPQLSQTLVAILTSSDSPIDRRETAALGANCYIKKPPSLDEFMDVGGTIKSLLFS